MIGSIKGKVAYLANEYCLLETNSGVGYRVFMPAAHLGQLAVGMEARVHTYMVCARMLFYVWLSESGIL